MKIPPRNVAVLAQLDQLWRQTPGANLGEMMDTIERIARLAHEVNRLYCESIGDTSQVAWKDAPDWQRESARRGVLFHLTHRDAGPEASHENWMKEKLEDGWRYGPVKDPAKKEHPCLVPFEMLPAEQQMKDRLFLTIVKGMRP